MQWIIKEAGWSPCWPQDPFAALTQPHSSRHRRGPGPWKKNILFCKNITKWLLYLRFADGSSDETTPKRSKNLSQLKIFILLWKMKPKRKKISKRCMLILMPGKWEEMMWGTKLHKVCGKIKKATISSVWEGLCAGALDVKGGTQKNAFFAKQT